MQSLDALAREAAALTAGHADHRRERRRAHAADLQCVPLLRRLLRGVPGDDAATGILAASTCTIWPTCATTAARVCMPASTRRRTSSASTCRARWRACGCRPTPSTPGPRRWAALYRRNGLALALALVAALTLFLVLAAASQGTLWQAPPAGDFYRVFPHGLMVGLFAPVFAFAVLALAARGAALLAGACMRGRPARPHRARRRATR